MWHGCIQITYTVVNAVFPVRSGKSFKPKCSRFLKWTENGISMIDNFIYDCFLNNINNRLKTYRYERLGKPTKAFVPI